MTRFDAPEYVAAWQAGGVFPRIHEPIARGALAELDPRDGVVLDLGSSTGLLTRRLAHCRYTVAAVQEPGQALELGRAAGTYDGVPVLAERVTEASLPALLAFVANEGVTAIVARRVFPELHDSLGERFPELVRGLRAAGVRRIVHEARAVSTRTTHPLGTPELERAALDAEYRTVCATGPVGYLEARP